MTYMTFLLTLLMFAQVASAVDISGNSIPNEILIKQFGPPSKEPIRTISTFNELKNLIENSKSKSVDELLLALKTSAPDFLGGYTMMYRTKALGRHLINPARPRIIMYGTNGRFIMTIHSHPQGRKAEPNDTPETIESIEFKGDRAFLREFSFNNNTVPDLSISKVPVNPSQCLNCHGSNAYRITAHIKRGCNVRLNKFSVIGLQGCTV